MNQADAHEFREFVAARSQSLLRAAYLLTGDAHLAQDLLQTALLATAGRWTRIRHRDIPRRTCAGPCTAIRSTGGGRGPAGARPSWPRRPTVRAPATPRPTRCCATASSTRCGPCRELRAHYDRVEGPPTAEEALR
jgi:hypothetical protein